MSIAYNKIGIVAALPEEMRLLKEKMTDRSEKMIAGCTFFCGKIGRYDIILVQCGMAKVSAALCTQILITVFSPEAVINTGCAGALAEELGIGSFVVSDYTCEWDIDLVAIGLPRGYVSSMDKVLMPADKALISCVKEAMPEGTECTEGLVVSGDEFISRNEQRTLILNSFPEAKCAEMEGAAVGHVCAQNGIPFCVVRCMSDTADGKSGVNFAEFSVMAGEKSAEVLINMLS